ncbi:MAG: HAMP domain-containing histidine kinase [Sphingobacteriales bacterium]|nr:HAMP domain-containing histidine kinase [Sphingobacteriales bacterium]
MDSATVNNENRQQEKQVPLKRLVNALINVKLHEVVRKESFFINEVQGSLPLNADRSIVINVLDNLFQNVLSETGKSCIRISAKEYSNVMLIHIYDNHESEYGTENIVSERIRVEANKIGGFVGVTRRQKNQTVIAFSFPNLPAAA